jgi:cation efflux family protein
MHKTTGIRDPAMAFPLPGGRDDAADRRAANRAVAVSAAGLAVTGVVELLLAVLTGSVGLLGDAIHNLSDVSTSAVVFLGFRLSRRPPTSRYPYGLERAEDLAGIGIAVVIWVSAAFAGTESIRKLAGHGHTAHVGAGIAGAGRAVVGWGAGRADRGGRGPALGRPGGRARGDRVHLPCRLGGHRRRGAPPGRRHRSRCHRRG